MKMDLSARSVSVEQLGGQKLAAVRINPGHGYIVSSEVTGKFIHVICTDFAAKPVCV